VYREVMGSTLNLEHPFTLSILGPEATYTHLAAIRHFGHQPHILFESSIPDIFLRVEKGDADAGLVPVENTTEGAVVHTLDRLVEATLVVSGEVTLEVRHQLLVHPSLVPAGHAAKRRNDSVRPITLKRIVSHPQPLAQCRNFLETYYPGVPLVPAASTAVASREAASHPGVAAIASELAADQYGLAVLHRNIEDLAENTTRFLIIRRDDDEQAHTPRTGRDKTSVAFSMKDRPGALFTMLEPFKKRGINLTKIESRPSRFKNWRYIFFLDMEGHHTDAVLKHALAELERECHFYRLLGSYPACV